MIVRSVAVSAALLVTACSQPKPIDNTVSGNTATANTSTGTSGGSLFGTNTATAATAAPEENEETAKAYAKCAAAGLTMSRIYTVLAESESGAKREDLLEKASQRKEGAKIFYDMTKKIALKIGLSEDDVADEVGDIGRSYDRIREEQGFETFVGTVGADTDKCREMVLGKS